MHPPRSSHRAGSTLTPVSPWWIDLLWTLALAALATWLLVALSHRYTTDRLPDDYGRFYRSVQAWRVGGQYYSAADDGLNLNPPPFLALFAPFTVLPVRTALACWDVLNLAALLVSARLVARELGVPISRAEVVAFALFAGTSAQVMLGQLAWLLMLPATLCWMDWRRRRWWRGGLWLGIVVGLKPIFLPLLALAALRRHWQILGGAGVALSSLIGIGLVATGIEGYEAWIALGASVSWFGFPLNASLRGMLARFSQAGWVPALWISLICATAAVAIQCLRRSPADADHDIAVGFTTSLLVSPLGWLYYLPLGLGPLWAVVGRQRLGPLAIAGLCALCWPAGVGWESPERQLLPGVRSLLTGGVYTVGVLTLWWLSLSAPPPAERGSSDPRRG